MTDKTAPKTRARKTPAKPKAQQAAAPKKAEPKVNEHIEAGVNFALYSGPSKGANGLRPVKIMVKDGVDKLTDRCQKNLYALRKAYGTKAFAAKGLDNGILRDLLAAGLIAVSGGKKEVRDGKPYILDGAEPVMVKITAAGQKYGTA